jgi:hypothetical protein
LQIPRWPALLVTASARCLFAIGDADVSVDLDVNGNPNLLTFLVDPAWTETERTFNVPDWIENPYVAARGYAGAAVVSVQKKPLKDYCGATQKLTFDGNTYIRKKFAYDTMPVGTGAVDASAWYVLARVQLDQLNGASADTFFTLSASTDTTDFLTVRALSNNTMNASVFQNGVLVGGPTPSHDFDTNGGIATFGWLGLSMVVNGANLVVKLRTYFNANNVNASSTIPLANLATLAPLDTITWGARIDGSVKLTTGLGERLFCSAGLLPDADWDAVIAGATDPWTLRPRGDAVLDWCLRGLFGLRDRVDGKLPDATAGTPTLSSSAGPTIVSAAYVSGVLEFDYSGTAVSGYTPDCDGVWELLSTVDADDIAVLFGDAPVATLADQKLTSTPGEVIGTGRQISAISDGAGTAWAMALVAGVLNGS